MFLGHSLLPGRERTVPHASPDSLSSHFLRKHPLGSSRTGRRLIAVTAKLAVIDSEGYVKIAALWELASLINQGTLPSAQSFASSLMNLTAMMTRFDFEDSG